MKRAVASTAYPSVTAPAYPRWLLAGALLLGMLVGAALMLRSLIEPQLLGATAIIVALLWMVALITRVLRYRVNRHNAQCYAQAVELERQAWWARHRQKAGLVQSVLVSSMCGQPEQVGGLFEDGHSQSATSTLTEEHAIRLAQVLSPDVLERERELAVLLALKWQAQWGEGGTVQPLSCYWQGSAIAWQAFREQMEQCCPDVTLPEHPEPWQGLRSLDAVIDQLQAAAAGDRILCAGCQSTAPGSEQRLPAGEAAVLWLLGQTGPVLFSRGEWFAAEAESLAAVAERALLQSEMAAPPPACASLSQPGEQDLAAMLWSVKAQRQDTHFGVLGGLEAMVMQTLAAWYAAQLGAPCAWLAADPEHALTLGIVTPHDSNP